VIDKFYPALRTEPNPYATNLGGATGGQLFILGSRRTPSPVSHHIRGKYAGKNAIKPTHDALLERFRQSFPEAAIQVEDESHLHVGHAGAEGGAGHFRVRVIDDRFNELQRIARHRLVYDAVSDWIPERVHALNIIAMTMEEAGHASTIQQGPSK